MPTGSKALLTTWQWLTVTGVLLGSAAGSIAWALSTFQTKENASERTVIMEKRIDNIERNMRDGFNSVDAKLNILIEREK